MCTLKKRRYQNNNLTLHLKKIKNEEQTMSTVSRRKKIIKIRTEINEIKNRKNQQNSRFF